MELEVRCRLCGDPASLVCKACVRLVVGGIVVGISLAHFATLVTPEWLSQMLWWLLFD